MTFSLRLLAGSRRLRAIGVLTWLMLVVNSLAAAPMGMTGGLHTHSVHAAVAATSEHCHHAAPAAKTARSCCHDRTVCCGGLSSQHCACAAMCVTALPPAAAMGLATAAMTAIYAMPARISAPSLAAAPPLRPPAV